MELLNDDPNFSIVLPGPCDAACGFCFAQKPPAFCGMLKYLTRLNAVLEALGPQFYQISITGGEPTMSPYLLPVLAVIQAHRRKYTNVLLTTNGSRLLEVADDLHGIVDHVNISRHHYDDGKNAHIFGGKYRVSTADAERMVNRLSATGIDVSVNCIVYDSTDVGFLGCFIGYAMSVGFKAVRFRKKNGDNNPIPAETHFAENYPVLWEGACPVCRTRKRVIRGMDVYFKTSVTEPDAVSDGKVFEIVFQPDGLCYTDWAGKNLLIDVSRGTTARRRETVSDFDSIKGVELPGQRPKKRRPVFPERKPSTSCGSVGCERHSSCGGSSRSSCGGGLGGRC